MKYSRDDTFTKRTRKEEMLSNNKTVQDGDLVVVYHSYTKLKPLYVKSGETLVCKEGHFPHVNFIGVPFGGLVSGHMPKKSDPTKPQILVLKPTPEVWTQAVPRRTQIIYATDISVIVQNLGLVPGSKVAEAGTGSGSLTHGLANAVAPNGQVYTYDFHKTRYEEAGVEFAKNGLGHVVTAGWRDVCSARQTEDESAGIKIKTEDEKKAAEGGEDKEGPPGGFDIPDGSLDAVFLDVPNPWSAVQNVRNVLKANGIFCSFSPCIEQTQKLVNALMEECDDCFASIRTVEALGREYQPSTYRSKRERGGDGIQEATEEVPQFVPNGVVKGHSAFLTFCRKRESATKK